MAFRVSPAYSQPHLGLSSAHMLLKEGLSYSLCYINCVFLYLSFFLNFLQPCLPNAHL